MLTDDADPIYLVSDADRLLRGHFTRTGTLEVAARNADDEVDLIIHYRR